MDEDEARGIARRAMELGASQHEDELAQALRVVAGVEPQVIVELGCDRGGTLYAWKQVAERVYGITREENDDSGGAPCVSYGAEVLYADTHEQSSLDWLLGKLGEDQPDVLVVDGDHFYNGIVADLRMYGPLVRPGGLIMLHDIIPVVYPAVQVWKLWPRLRDQLCATEIGFTFGWGIIHVVGDEDFTELTQ